MKGKYRLLLLFMALVLAACGGGDIHEETEGELTAPEADVLDQEQLDAAGSEVISGQAPPLPEAGAKVETERTTNNEAQVEGTAPLRADAAGEVVVEVAQNSQLTAGEVDDNVNWDDYLLYLRDYTGAAVLRVDVSERHQIVVQDGQERPILGAVVDITANEQLITTLRTHSNGRVLFFPRAYEPTAVEYTVNITVNGLTESFVMPAGGPQREWMISHPGGEQLPDSNRLDVLFLIDATSSMADEINQLKENIEAIAAQIETLPAQPDVRFGMVTYRDRGDIYVTQVTDFTPDVAVFAERLAQVQADGGGDYAEDLNEALTNALHDVEWRLEETVSLIFLVADAPPHLDYGQESHYALAMREAATGGIKIYPIASSGLDEQGEYVFRQLAQFTDGRFIFLTYGPEGPGSTGTETDLNVADYTVAALDQLVVRIVEEELGYLVR